MDVAPTVPLAFERLAAGATYDAVIADLNLPDGSALDVLAHIREHGLPLARIESQHLLQSIA